ncbi:MAG: hypothetical protein HQL28_01720 [Candidatus Omnitrophica bacterium]|nr:hypothetical protein [Candidatus Omnitrophota bacterium]
MNILNVNIKYKILTAALLLTVSTIVIVSSSEDLLIKKDPPHYKPYLDFVDQVYKAMDAEYFKPVDRYAYEGFLEKYKEKVLKQLPPNADFIPFVAWKGAGLMVNSLKAPNDRFSNFIPPKIAKQYSDTIYGYKNDIGITGKKIEQGFLVLRVEKRSDSFAKGLRTNYIITEINAQSVLPMTEDQINVLLTPDIDSVVKIRALNTETKELLYFEIVSKTYFKETLVDVPTGMPGIFCLQMPKFNQETANDMADFLRDYNKKGMKFLIIDIRDNPGGPPLAVREICGYFLKPHLKLCYYKKKNAPVFGMIAPDVSVHYGGPMAIIIDKKSGSASELFVGTLKAYKRAIIVGKEPTAGMAFLKGMHKFDDGSMLAMITGLSYVFNGQELDLNGVTPNVVVPGGVGDEVQFLVRKIAGK